MRLQPPHGSASRDDAFVIPTYLGLGAEPRAGQAFPRGFAFVLAIAAEYRQAMAATHRTRPRFSISLDARLPTA